MPETVMAMATGIVMDEETTERGWVMLAAVIPQADGADAALIALPVNAN